MAWKRTILDAARRTGALGAVGRLYGADRLTVLAYHRVIDHKTPGFASFVGNVSASPEEFASQMEWLARRFTVVSLDEVVDSLGGAPLPDRPALITFDDGYRDNLVHALPVLQRLGLPAVLFVATEHVASGEPFWWDRAAAFFAAGDGEADLPFLGPTRWTAADGHTVTTRWIAEAKTKPDSDLRASLEAMEAMRPGVSLEGLVLDWEGVRSLVDGGVTIGAHTRTHPILTRVPADEAAAQIRGSRADVEAVIEGPARAFAYPNGTPSDFDDHIVAMVRDAGFAAAFTLVPGPARRREILTDPFRVRRIYVHHGDGLSRFAAKVAGMPRISRAVR